MLLHSRVELALDPAAVGIGRQDESPPRRSQLRDLEAEPIDRLFQLGRQVASIPRGRDASFPTHSLADAVVAATGAP